MHVLPAMVHQSPNSLCMSSLQWFIRAPTVYACPPCSGPSEPQQFVHVLPAGHQPVVLCPLHDDRDPHTEADGHGHEQLGGSQRDGDQHTGVLQGEVSVGVDTVQHHTQEQHQHLAHQTHTHVSWIVVSQYYIDKLQMRTVGETPSHKPRGRGTKYIIIASYTH